MKMNELDIGQFGYVKSMRTNGSIRRRLQDIGLIEGTKIQCVLKSPALDPNAYLIRGAVIALRKEDVFDIEIQGMDSCG